MFGRKRAGSSGKRARERRPHPDPRIEAELQRIISLRRQIGRYEESAATAAREASEADRQSRRVSYHGPQTAAGYVGRAEDLRKVAAEADEKITALHEEIAKRISALSDEDLLWLDPR